MKVWSAEDVRDITGKLFLGTVFDQFWVREASVTTFNTFHIDGHIRKGYYSCEELKEQGIGELSSWKVLRPVCFSLIKGKKLPGSFQITLQLSKSGTEAFLQKNQISCQPEQMPSLCLNIRYEEGKLSCVSGTASAAFTMDKSLDWAWEEALEKFFRKNEIVCRAV